MADIGKYRHRVRIEQRVDPQTQSASGEITTPWTLFLEAWASIEPMMGFEALQQSRVTATVTHRVKMRPIVGVVPWMRIVHTTSAGTKTFSIEAVLTPNTPDEMVLACQEVVGA